MCLARDPTDLAQKNETATDPFTQLADEHGPRFGCLFPMKKPGRNRALLAVTPSTRSWNEFSAFIEEWDKLRMAA
jgi:hypothetical protein